MDGILNWYREEGTIFKGGSGSGINLSNIRSSQEHLKGGGTASGPVSFMRGADASAGTIKSGGKTRRAAKMVILNTDHPDIEEFIWCKAIEERKARCCDAGFDMDLDGKDSHSIQYQNANNSVRVTDEFMEAVLEDGDWDLKAVTSGETIQTVKARDLMRQISEATWECADPGMQFDTTINRWHTAPTPGASTAATLVGIHAPRQLGVQPREHQLAQVPERRRHVRRRGVQAHRRGDVHRAGDHRRQRRLSHGEDRRQHPQVPPARLGYANLGALLMAQGMAYDSDEGRAWAGTITALMTGHAYATSAHRGAHGPVRRLRGQRRADVERAADAPRLRWPRSTKTSSRPSCSAPRRSRGTTLWSSARRSASATRRPAVLAPTGTIGLMMDCDTTGIEPDLALTKAKKLVGGGTMFIVNQTIPRALRKLGYSDEQVDAIVAYIDEHKTIMGAPDFNPEHLPVFACSMGDNTIHYMGHVTMMGAVQPFISGAISKCVVGDTLITTADGLVRIGSLHNGEAPDSFRDEVLEVASLDGTQKTDAFYYGGIRPVREVVLRSGHRVVGTPNHRLLVAGRGQLDWMPLEDVLPDEYVAVQYGAELWSSLPARFDDFAPTAAYGGQKHVRLPETMSAELAFLLGAYASEGHTTRSTYTISITNSVDGVLEKVAAAWEAVFGVTAKIVRPADRCAHVLVASKTIVEFLEYLGCGSRASEKRIPDSILRSPRYMLLAFLQGLALDAYATVGSAPKWGICLDAPGLLDDLQAVLTNLGIVHSRVSKLDKTYDKTYDEVYATGEHAQRLIELVPFLEPDKAARASGLTALDFSRAANTADVVPGISPRDLYELIPKARPGRSGRGLGTATEFAFLCDDRTRHVTRRTLERVSAIPGVVLPEWLQAVLRDNLHFSPVVSVGRGDNREVFDVSVPTTHAFVGNGIVNHNTVNMPEDHGRRRRAAAPRGVEARHQGRRDLPRQLQGRPAARHAEEGVRDAGRRGRADHRARHRAGAGASEAAACATRRRSRSGWPTAAGSRRSLSSRTAVPVRCSSTCRSRAPRSPGSWTRSRSRSATVCSTAFR